MNLVETSTIGVEAFERRVGWRWSFHSTSLFQKAVICHGIAQNVTVQRMELTDVISLSDRNFQQPRKSPVKTSNLLASSVETSTIGIKALELRISQDWSFHFTGSSEKAVI
jgi:hypothetical protein